MKTFLSLFLVCFLVTGYTQKKPKINKAVDLVKEKNFLEAKSIVDEAIVFEKLKGDPRTWFVRGQVYVALDTSLNEQGALKNAVEAFNKANELDPKGDKTTTVDYTTGSVTTVESSILNYFNYYYLKAVEGYNVENFGVAAENFELAYQVKIDTNAILNAAYAYLSDENEEKGEKNFKRALEEGAKDKNIFLQLYNYSLLRGDKEASLEIIRKGRSVYPNDVDLMRFEVSLLIQLEQLDDAKAQLENAIAEDPKNADLYFTMGVLQDETGNKDKALENYNKAIEIDSEHYNSNYNRAVIYFTQATEMMKESNALDYRKDADRIEELEIKTKAQLEKSLPHWEKLYGMKSAEASVLETLKFIYSSLRMNDEFEKIDKELEALQGE